MSAKMIRSFIVDRFLFGDAKELSDTTPLLETHIIDSTGVLEIVSYLEERFKIRVEDADMTPENLNSIKSIDEYLRRKTAVLV